MDLRTNQIEPVRIGVEFFKNTKNIVPSIIVAPTAFGKSIVIASIATQVNDNLLILQPSKELLEQNYNKFSLLGGSAEIYSASFNRKNIGSVTYATIGSIKSIGAKFKELGFTKMIIDEAHLYPRNSDSMLGKFLKESEITHVLGLTATPLKLQSNTDISGNTFSKLSMLTSRSKKGQFFKELIHVSQVQEMIDLGFWSKLEYEQYDIEEGKLVYNSSMSDFTEASINAVYESNNLKEKIWQKIQELPDRKSIVVFVPSVANAMAFARIVDKSVAIYGDMPPKEREQAISGFRSGDIRVIFNVNVVSVGFDCPEIDCLVVARPTSSLGWYYQALGRGTRISPFKKNCLIVDFSGNVKRFGKIEKLVFVKENIWKLYGEGGKLLTGIPIHEIGGVTRESENYTQKEKEPIVMFGIHKGKHIKDVPEGYLKWMVGGKFEWKDWNMFLKVAIEKFLEDKKQPEVKDVEF
jgi:DNA repair protein RadD